MEVKPIKDIKLAIDQRLFPTIVMWNRLEGRPRTHHFQRALKAEVRDALWMLSKQWQMGEFKADDAGTPAFAKIHISSTELSQFTADGNNAQELKTTIPLEVKAEQMKIPFVRNNMPANIAIRLQMGRMWLKMLADKGLDFSQEYIGKYKFILPAQDNTGDQVFAHKERWQQYAAISGRAVDGYELFIHIDNGGKASEAIINTDPEMSLLDALGDQFKAWYIQLFYQPLQEHDDAWLPDRLEYNFRARATGGIKDRILSAEQYYSGSPEWYVFDSKTEDVIDNGQREKTMTNSFVPAHVQFEGMPNTRWWAFEDSKTNFGDIKPSTTELSKLLLAEFGLVFANDWFLVPQKLPIGVLANIEGLVVTNNFGDHTWIKSSEQTGVENQWTMFKLNAPVQDNTLFLAPTAMKVHEGNPLEEIVLIRDEMSNMVWGIEKTVSSPLGKGEKGSEAALRTNTYHQNLVGNQVVKSGTLFFNNLLAALPNLKAGIIANKTDIEQVLFNVVTDFPDSDARVLQLVNSLVQSKKQFSDLATESAKEEFNLGNLKQQLQKNIADFYDQVIMEIKRWYEGASNTNIMDTALHFLDLKKNKSYAAKISYLAMTEVPENWIPFVPVHVENDNRETQLQRASMLRIIEGDTAAPVKIKPQTGILREGLEQLPKPLPFYIHEEEVPRAGINVTQAFQRTRWINGEVYVWLGMKKKTGRGEGSSNLAFDQIKDS